MLNQLGRPACFDIVHHLIQCDARTSDRKASVCSYNRVLRVYDFIHVHTYLTKVRAIESNLNLRVLYHASRQPEDLVPGRAKKSPDTETAPSMGTPEP